MGKERRITIKAAKGAIKAGIMSDKERALQLHQSGLSYKEIAQALGIGKTTAYQYVKESRQNQLLSAGFEYSSKQAGLAASSTDEGEASPNDAKRANEKEAPRQKGNKQEHKDAALSGVNNIKSNGEKPSLEDMPAPTQPHKSIFGGYLKSQATSLNKASNARQADNAKAQPAAITAKEEKKPQVFNAEATPKEQKQAHIPGPASATSKSAPRKLKEFTGDDLVAKKFECLPFSGKFLALIGKPSKLFSGIIWGLPKGGKSNFSIRFADYLQEYFGNVVYIAAEEGESVTLQEKFKEIGGSKVTVVETRDKEQIRSYLPNKKCDFVFIDSISNAGIDNECLELLKAENPTKSFISIVQATKGGNFKGDQALTHNCDFIIKIVDGIAYHQGRFNVASEMSIFEEPLYEKNPAAPVAPCNQAADSKGEGSQTKSNGDCCIQAGVIKDVANGCAATCTTEFGKDNMLYQTSSATDVGKSIAPLFLPSATDADLHEQISTDVTKHEPSRSIFGYPRLPEPVTVPMKTALTNTPLGTSSARAYNSYLGSGFSGLGSSAQTIRTGDYSPSRKGTEKSRKAKKKKASATADGFGDAILIFGAGFLGGCAYYELRCWLAKKAEGKVQSSAASAKSKKDATIQQAKSLPPASDKDMAAHVPAQLHSASSQKSFAQHAQKETAKAENTAQQLSSNRKQHELLGAPLNAMDKDETGAETWWGLNGQDTIL